MRLKIKRCASHDCEIRWYIFFILILLRGMESFLGTFYIDFIKKKTQKPPKPQKTKQEEWFNTVKRFVNRGQLWRWVNYYRNRTIYLSLENCDDNWINISAKEFRWQCMIAMAMNSSIPRTFLLTLGVCDDSWKNICPEEFRYHWTIAMARNSPIQRTVLLTLDVCDDV